MAPSTLTTLAAPHTAPRQGLGFAHNRREHRDRMTISQFESARARVRSTKESEAHGMSGEVRGNSARRMRCRWGGGAIGHSPDQLHA